MLGTGGIGKKKEWKEKRREKGKEDVLVEDWVTGTMDFKRRKYKQRLNLRQTKTKTETNAIFRIRVCVWCVY